MCTQGERSCEPTSFLARPFPDYDLPDHTGKHRTLSELQQRRPAGRGAQPRRLLPQGSPPARGAGAAPPRAEVGYCRLVTISTDNLLETNELRAASGAHWPFLSDPARKVQKDLDIAEYTDPHPQSDDSRTRWCSSPGCVVHKIYNGYWFFGRPTVEELRLDLRAVLQKCRPDWDIGTPQLAAWERNEKAGFYPYGKSEAEVLSGG